MNEWEWSFIDDPLQKMGWFMESIHRSGWGRGVLDHIYGQARADWNGWGLFRPAWYVYSGRLVAIGSGRAVGRDRTATCRGEQWRFVAAALLGATVFATGHLVAKIINTQLTRSRGELA